MKAFQHKNVLSLIGVCIDAGAAPYLVMPYMLNGSLLAYLRKKRPDLTIVEGAADELVSVKVNYQWLNLNANLLYNNRLLKPRRNCCLCVSKLPKEWSISQ